MDVEDAPLFLFPEVLVLLGADFGGHVLAKLAHC